MIKIILVDDHKIIRDGLKALLMGSDEVEIVGECTDGIHVNDYLRKNKENVDVVLMDINMPELNGIDATKKVLNEFPGTKILVLTMHNEEGYISKILKAGAKGYILKNTGDVELIDAIKKVNDGATYFSSEVSEIMMAKYMKDNNAPKLQSSLVTIDDLTERELEVLKLIAEEQTNNQIAEILCISPRTVDTHRRNLAQKLGVKNAAGLVRFAVENHVVD